MIQIMKKHRQLMILLLVFVLLYLIPFSIYPYPGGNDFKAQFNRIYAISENLRHSKILFPIYQTTLFNYGYASPLFYGDLLLYPFAILILLGLPYDAVALATTLGVVILEIIISYYAGCRIFRNKDASFLFSFLYVFSSYLTFNNAYRFALGEAFGTAFFPLIILGFWSITYDDKKYWLYLPVGLSSCMYSHVLSTLLSVLVLSILFVLSIKRLFEDPDRFRLILISVLLFFGLSASFIFPMIEQMLSTKFLSTTGQSATIFGTLLHNAFPTTRIFSDFNMILNRENEYFRPIPNGVGLFPITTIIYATLIKRTKNRRFYVAFALGLFFLFAITRRFPWDSLQNIFGIIQFPWRLMSHATFFFALSAAFLIKEENRFNKLFIIVVCALSLFSSLMIIYPRYKYQYNAYINKLKYDYNYYSRIGSGEFLPALKGEDGSYLDYETITDYLYDRSETITSNNLKNTDMSFKRNYNEIYVEYRNNNYDDSYIEVPLLMYKGYKATDLETKEKLDLSYGQYNVVRVYLNDNEGRFLVRYQRTPVQIVSICTTVGTAVLTGLYLFKIHRKKGDI